MKSPTVLILCKRKARSNSAFALERELTERGVSCYRATPLRRPACNLHRVQTIVNYGVSMPPNWLHMIGDRLGAIRWLNLPETVRISADKRLTFPFLTDNEVPTLEWTRSRSVAQGWSLESNGAYGTVVARTILQGSRGDGIVLSPPDEMPRAQLYTKRFRAPRVREYRVYIVGDRAIDVTEKRRYNPERLAELDIDPEDPYGKLVRTNANGWAFCRGEMQATPEEIERIKQVALQAAAPLDLKLGGIDIIVGRTKEGELTDMRVVEPNTCISLTGDTTTRTLIANALAEELRNVS